MCNHLINKISVFLLYKKIYGTNNRIDATFNYIFLFSFDSFQILFMISVIVDCWHSFEVSHDRKLVFYVRSY